jgi:hypothetical protein
MRFSIAATLLVLSPLLTLSYEVETREEFGASALTNAVRGREPQDAFDKHGNTLDCDSLPFLDAESHHRCCTTLGDTDSAPTPCRDPIAAFQPDTPQDPSTTDTDRVGTLAVLPTSVDASSFTIPVGSNKRSASPNAESLPSTTTTDQTVSVAYIAYPQEGGYRGEGVATASVTWGMSSPAVKPTSYALPTDMSKLLLPGKNHPLVAGDFAPISADIYRHRAQSAVNLGFWLVAEQWGTPQYFASCATSDSAEFNIAEGCSKEYMEDFWST